MCPSLSMEATQTIMRRRFFESRVTMGPLVLVTLILAILKFSLSMALVIYLPDRCKTEGKVTLMLPDAINNQTIKHHLPFTETIDRKGLRSTISIGYVSYTPTRYFARKDSPVLTVDSNGNCSSYDDRFVSSLSMFAKAMFPAEVLASGVLDQTLAGPTSLIKLIQQLIEGTKHDQPRETVHRNIPCTVYVYHKVLDSGTTLEAEFYVPTDLVFNSLKTIFFSVKASTYNTNDLSKLDAPHLLRASYLVDYYFIDDATKDPDKFDRMVRSDFNIPLAAGCSRFLKNLSPDVSKESFSMSYKQVSTLSSFMLAYDHSSGLLRKERLGESVSVWDLREDLMYHVDVDLGRSLIGLSEDFATKEPRICSVMKVTDDKLGPAFRPYEKAGEPIDVLRLIGASSVSYMGTGSVRDLPCSIYETIIDEPPAIFALTAEQLQRQSAIDRQYILQFYLLESDRLRSSNAGDDRLPATGFWPAQINLYRQFLVNGTVELIDQLEVYDFFWSLDGWTKKNNELFMVGECFDDANKQVRLELALTFDKLHSSPTSVGDKAGLSLLPYNKFKLEYDLIEDIFRNVFDVSKMHLVGYELKLRPSHVAMHLLIADRSKDMELTYFGEGELADDRAYESNRLDLTTAQTEESCISTGSLINDISMIIYCPFHAHRDSSCTAVYDEPEPVFRKQVITDPLAPTCHVYRFKSAPLPKQALGEVISRKQLLYKRPFNFKARTIGGGREERTVELVGRIQDFELEHDIQLIRADHHAFIMPDAGDERRLLRSFDSIDYRTPNDCERICNLDTNCRSYSFCKLDKKCILSSFDIRSSDLLIQLVREPAVKDKATGKMVVTVNDTQTLEQYKLSMEEDCFVYERNYLSFYKQTEEVISLDLKLAKQFPIAPSTFYCAKMSIDTEANYPEHHVAMFAYCELTNVCILDENLFKPATNASIDAGAGSGDAALADIDQPVDEMSCRIYRKRYQTYFSISSQVIKDSAENQLDLKLNTIEECARACWIRFGQVCASFDYCSPGSCKINKVSVNDLDGQDKLETKSGCLHYERDLELDRLREQHLIGRHQVLAISSSDEDNSMGRLAMNILTYVLAFGAFIYGLALGRKVNDRMEAVTISRQSISVANLDRAAFDYQSFPLDDDGAPTNILGSQMLGPSDAIKMDVIHSDSKQNNGKIEQ